MRFTVLTLMFDEMEIAVWVKNIDRIALFDESHYYGSDV